jgi:hypothetical protein
MAPEDNRRHVIVIEEQIAMHGERQLLTSV